MHVVRLSSMLVAVTIIESAAMLGAAVAGIVSIPGPQLPVWRTTREALAAMEVRIRLDRKDAILPFQAVAVRVELVNRGVTTIGPVHQLGNPVSGVFVRPLEKSEDEALPWVPTDLNTRSASTGIAEARVNQLNDALPILIEPGRSYSWLIVVGTVRRLDKAKPIPAFSSPGKYVVDFRIAAESGKKRAMYLVVDVESPQGPDLAVYGAATQERAIAEAISQISGAVATDADVTRLVSLISPDEVSRYQDDIRLAAARALLKTTRSAPGQSAAVGTAKHVEDAIGLLRGIDSGRYVYGCESLVHLRRALIVIGRKSDADRELEALARHFPEDRASLMEQWSEAKPSTLPRTVAQRLPHFAESLKSSDEVVRFWNVRSLAWTGPENPDQVNDLLSVALRDKEPRVRLIGAMVAASLNVGPTELRQQSARILATEGLDILEPWADDFRPFIVQSLGRLGKEASPHVPAIVRLLDERKLSMIALRAICDLGAYAKIARPRLVELLNDPVISNDDAKKRLIQDALNRVGPEK